MTQLPNDLESYVLCAMLQGRANFFMDHSSNKIVTCERAVTPQKPVKM